MKANFLCVAVQVRLLVVNAAFSGPRGTFLDGGLGWTCPGPVARFGNACFILLRTGESKTVVDVNILAMLTSAHVFGNHLSQQGSEVPGVLTVPAPSNFGRCCRRHGADVLSGRGNRPQ